MSTRNFDTMARLSDLQSTKKHGRISSTSPEEAEENKETRPRSESQASSSTTGELSSLHT